jgi:hypothetical protein
MIICKDKYHEDLYEDGELVPLRKIDMVGKICVGCDEERRDNDEFERQNAPDFN